MNPRRIAIAVALLAFGGVAGGGVQAVEQTERGPGCDPDKPVVAHHEGGAILEEPPEGGPMVCAMYTGFPGGESRINVTNTGAVIFSPAPYLRGAGSLGLGDTGLVDGPFAREPNQRQWMFQNGGVAVSHDNGATWRLVKPHNMTWVMDDADAHVDRDTGRYYWSVLTPSPYPQLQPGAIPIYEHTIITDAHLLTSPDDGLTWSHAKTCCPIADRVWFMTAKAPPGQPEPIAGYPNVAYYIHPSGGGTVSRSLDAGNSWTVVGSIISGETSECAPVSHRFGTHIAADRQGFLYVPLVCDDEPFLARSTDSAATWHLLRPIPNRGAVRIDDADNMYMVRQVGQERLMLSVSADLGETWSREFDLTGPEIVKIHNTAGVYRYGDDEPRTDTSWFFQVRDPGHLIVSYHGRKDGQDTYDGYMTATRNAFDTLTSAQGPLFWTAMVNDPDKPLLYGDILVGVGRRPGTDPGSGSESDPLDAGIPPFPPPQIDHIGADIAPDGSAWASFTEDCGPSPDAPRCQDQNVQTRGLAARLVWPRP